MKSRRPLLAILSLFAFMTTHSTWGGIKESRYAQGIEDKLKTCLKKSNNTETKVQQCNTEAILKILKWHQGTFQILPWYRDIPEIVSDNLAILRPESLTTDDKK